MSQTDVVMGNVTPLKKEIDLAHQVINAYVNNEVKLRKRIKELEDEKEEARLAKLNRYPD